MPSPESRKHPPIRASQPQCGAAVRPVAVAPPPNVPQLFSIIHLLGKAEPLVSKLIGCLLQ